jgi:hypothetical protein
MDSIELQKHTESLIYPAKSRFLGVFPRDWMPELPHSPRLPVCYIMNSDPSSLPGSHWLAVFATDSDDLNFFDSFACPPAFYDIHFSSIAQSVASIALQSIDSTVCGHYCIYYLFHKALGHSNSSILDSFSSHDLHWNDRQVHRFVKKHYVPRSLTALYSHCPATQTCCSKRSLC